MQKKNVRKLIIDTGQIRVFMFILKDYKMSKENNNLETELKQSKKSFTLNLLDLFFIPTSYIRCTGDFLEERKSKKSEKITMYAIMTMAEAMRLVYFYIPIIKQVNEIITPYAR